MFSVHFGCKEKPPYFRNSERSMLEKESDIHSLDSSLKGFILGGITFSFFNF